MEAIEKRIAEIEAELVPLREEAEKKDLAYDRAYRAKSKAQSRLSAKLQELENEKRKLLVIPQDYIENLRAEYDMVVLKCREISSDKYMTESTKRIKQDAWGRVRSAIEWQAESLGIEL